MQFIIALLICTVGLPQPPLAHWGCDYGHGHSQMVGAPDQPFELLAAVAPPRGAPDAQDFESLFGSTGIINIGFCPIYGLVARYKWMVSVRARRAAVCARRAAVCAARCCVCAARCCVCAARCCVRGALLCVRRAAVCARRAAVCARRAAVCARRAAVCARRAAHVLGPHNLPLPHRCVPYRDSTQAPSPAHTTPPS
jgi:hypothetical protein